MENIALNIIVSRWDIKEGANNVFSKAKGTSNIGGKDTEAGVWLEE